VVGTSRPLLADCPTTDAATHLADVGDVWGVHPAVVVSAVVDLDALCEWLVDRPFGSLAPADSR
jgi:hypothetical protein